ncbi:MAG: hypothetical protein OFPI_20840 [Osedax symbiont Rs2]|nr:MAG: hypothetical protein OFPI_20840 [Osedax symbiont Rs2]
MLIFEPFYGRCRSVVAGFTRFPCLLFCFKIAALQSITFIYS